MVFLMQLNYEEIYKIMTFLWVVRTYRLEVTGVPSEQSDEFSRYDLFC